MENNNNIKLICFDLDNTLITENSWKKLGLAFGISAEEDRRLYDEYKEGLYTYDEWNNIIIKRYLEHGEANRENITKILSNYALVDGVREVIEYLKSKDYTLVIISGSIDILIDAVAKDLGVQYAKANNTFEFDGSGIITGVHSDGDDTLAKVTHLKDFCKILNVDITECACIADGANDVEMFRKTGNGITFRGSAIENEAWKVIDSLEDLKNIFR